MSDRYPTLGDLLTATDDNSPEGEALNLTQYVHDPDSPDQGFRGTGTYSDNPFGANQFVGYSNTTLQVPGVSGTTTQQQQQSKRTK